MPCWTQLTKHPAWRILAACKGKTFLNLTNGTPSQALRASARLQTLGAQGYLTVATMTTPSLVGAETSFLFCSGRSSHRATALEVLGLFGRMEDLGDDPAAASVHDLALLAAMYGMFDGALTGIAMLCKALSAGSLAGGGRRKQGPVTATTATHMVPMQTAILPSLVHIAEQVETSSDSAGDHLNHMMLQGLRNIVLVGGKMGVDAGAARHLMKVFEQVEAEGGGDGGIGLVGRK